MTQIEKEALFAQYWGQKVGGNRYSNNYRLNKSNLCAIEWLNLKSIESITDEDAKALGYMDKGHFLYSTEDGDELSQQEADKLRELGYLVGWRNYTTEQLIESGIAKI